MTIVIVGADAATIDLARTTLEDEHIDVLGADEYTTVLALADARPPDVVVLDADAPRVRAHAVCGELLDGRRLAGPRVIGLVGSKEAAIRILTAGAHDAIVKPVTPVRLLCAVERVLPETEWLSP